MQYVGGDSDAEAWRRSSPPENEVPVAMALGGLLARTDDAAVSLAGVRAYTTGLELEVAIRLRRESDQDPFGHRAPFSRSDETAGARFLFGVEYADGRTVMNLGGDWGAGRDEPAGPASDELLLSSTGGSWGGRTADQGFWLAPLPPPGPLVVVCAWQAVGLPETRTVLDGSGIAEAGAQAVVLWPWEPPDDGHAAEQPPEPDLPAGSWFAQAWRRQHGGR